MIDGAQAAQPVDLKLLLHVELTEGAEQPCTSQSENPRLMAFSWTIW